MAYVAGVVIKLNQLTQMSKGTIRLHRFCSMGEFLAYRRGDVLQNNSTHSPRATTSVGFCFFRGNIDDWAHRLNGLVDFDVLLTLDVPRDAVTRSKSVYTNWANRAQPRPATFPEYCTTTYDREMFKLVNYDFSFALNHCFISRSILQQILAPTK